MRSTRGAAWMAALMCIGIADAKRLITIDDVMALRVVDTLSVSPDGHRFAIFVWQSDPQSNDFRTGWFVGNVRGGALTPVGDGGKARGSDDGEQTGGSESRWSPDGQWIAYTLWGAGERQLWRSKVDGSAQEQMTHNAADVYDFAWRDDGALYFVVGTSRVERLARQQARSRQGYRYNEDINAFTDFMKSSPAAVSDAERTLRVVDVGTHRERVASASEHANFERLQAHGAAGTETTTGFYGDAAVLPVARADGALVWLERIRPSSRYLRVAASFPQKGGRTIQCAAEGCSGVIQRVWWSGRGERVLFWRREGINERTHGFYAWVPASPTVSTLLQVRDADLRSCTPATGDHLICVRETPTHPTQVVSIDLNSGAMRIVADPNPEFENIRLGKVERFEWDTPKLSWNEPGGSLAGLYGKRAYGYILYPPDFDPALKYPVFIDPYVANDFTRPGTEHALHVYAARGFVVLNTEFPFPFTETAERLGSAVVKQLYSAELGFPHLTMLMESTLRGLDVAAARGFIDERRVGIGGVSHGTFVPLYMLQKYDRIAAISISSPHWGPFQYYWLTRKGRGAEVDSYGKVGTEDWMVKPEGAGREFWKGIDIADHVDEIEAPILMQLADQETFGLLRLIRHLDDAGRPYDAFVFPHETHVKWQPAHLHTIMNRNLDWFRFWLQDYEDPDIAKKEQYARWMKLREQQCLNPRVLRKEACRAASAAESQPRARSQSPEAAGLP